MITLVESDSRTVLLCAPHAGLVHLCAPRALCGELEVFEAGETIASVSSGTGETFVTAPTLGFVNRWLVTDAGAVEGHEPVVEFSIAR